MAEAYIPRGDPGPLPASPNALGGPRRTSDHEPYLELLDWIFTGRSPVSSVHGGRAQKTFRSMSGDQRIAWMRRNCPRTYSLLASGHRWAELSDF